MQTDRELMQMALDALRWDSLGKGWINPKTSDAMYALRDRLAQPEREWVGLTDEDLSVCDEDGVLLARYWEAKLKEKNT
jgi:hypothetical protein